jgi:hypothetical protein
MVNDFDAVNVIQLLRFENEFFSEWYARRPGDEAVLFGFSSLVEPRTSFIQEWEVNEWGGLTSEVSVLKTTFSGKRLFLLVHLCTCILVMAQLLVQLFCGLLTWFIAAGLVMTMSERIFYFLASSLVTKQGKIYVSPPTFAFASALLRFVVTMLILPLLAIVVGSDSVLRSLSLWHLTFLCNPISVSSCFVW